MRILRSISLLVMILAAPMILGCWGGAVVIQEDPPIELYTLWLFPGFYSDFGATFALDRQRAITEAFLYDRGVFMYSKVVQNVSDTDCFDMIQQLLEAGFNEDHAYDAWVISYPPHIACADMIAADPRFSHIPQFVTGEAAEHPTRSTMTLNVYEARFIHGMMCAMASQEAGSDTVGMVVQTLSLPDYVRSLHGFVAGVRLINPSLKVLVAHSGTIYGPVAYTKSAHIIIDKGVSCLAAAVPTISPNLVAASRGASSVALHPFAREYAGPSVLLNMRLAWEQSLSQNLLRLAHNESYPNLDILSVANGTITVLDISPEVGELPRRLLYQLRQNMSEGREEPFCTPQFSDLELFSHPNASFELTPGKVCLTPIGIKLLTGLPYGTELVVQFDETNSPWVYRFIYWNSLPSIVLIVLVGLLILASALGLASVAVNRHAAVYNVASPFFLALILIGVIVGCISCVLWIGEPTKAQCLAPWWLLGMSLSLIYSCVLAKNFRIWRIFSSDSLKLVHIMDVDLLLKFVLSCLLFEVSILITLTLYEPPVPIEDIGFSYLQYDEVQIMCRPPMTATNSRYFLLTVFIYHFSLLLSAAQISFKTRNAKKEYRESESIAIVIGISMTIQLLIAFISFAFPTNYKVVFYMNAYGNWALMLTAYGGLFLPKFWAFHVRGYTAVSGASESVPQHLSSAYPLPSMGPSPSMMAPEMLDADENPLGSVVDDTHGNPP